MHVVQRLTRLGVEVELQDPLREGRAVLVSVDVREVGGDQLRDDLRTRRKLTHGPLDRRAIRRGRGLGDTRCPILTPIHVKGHEVEHRQRPPVCRVARVVGEDVPVWVDDHAALGLGGRVVPPVRLTVHRVIGKVEGFDGPCHVVHAVERACHAGQFLGVTLRTSLVIGCSLKAPEVAQEALRRRRLTRALYNLVLVRVGRRGPEHEALRLRAARVKLGLAQVLDQSAGYPRVLLLAQTRPHDRDDHAVARVRPGVAVGGVDEGAKSEASHEGGQGLGGRVRVQRDRATVLHLPLLACRTLQAASDVAAAILHALRVVCAVHEALPRQRGGLPATRGDGRCDRQVKGEIGGGLCAHQFLVPSC